VSNGQIFLWGDAMRGIRRKHRILTATICIFFSVQFLFAMQVEELKIEIVQGNGARNVAGRLPPGPLAVRVLDQNKRPVQGASVVFSAPDSGAGGVFSNGSQVIIVTTDQDGRAAARFQPNTTEGSYTIQVLARQVLVTAVAEIPQTNVAATAAAEKGSKKKLVAILAAAGAAAGTGIALAARGGSDNSQSTPPPTGPTISFGGATVGAPR
jgi:hypothetical protein